MAAAEVGNRFRLSVSQEQRLWLVHTTNESVALLRVCVRACAWPFADAGATLSGGCA